MNVDLDQIQIPTYRSGSYNFIRRLRNEVIPAVIEHATTSERTGLGVARRSRGASIAETISKSRSTPVKLDVAIVGAGVGGLSTAIALKREGHTVTVYEQASALSEVGAGIQIPPNSSRILHSWGLKASLERRSVKPSSIMWRRWQDGSIIGNARLNPCSEEKFGSPYYVTHRAHLHDALHERAVELGVHVKLRKKVEVYKPDEGIVRFADGEVVNSDLVIAADGLKSFARKVLNGDQDKGPFGHGLSAYRATVPMSAIRADPQLKWIADSPSLNLWVGYDLHVMSYAIAGGEKYNLVLTHPTSSTDIQPLSSAEALSKMRAYYGRWDPTLKRLLDLVTETVDWPINAIDIPKTWSSNSGKLLLIGDAAHAMVPYMALGAAMAVEDAAALAAALTHLRSKGNLANIISRWTAIRKPRVTRVHHASFGHGLILHLPDGPVQKARDEALRGELAQTAVGHLETGLPDITESPNQWSDPTLTQWVYSYRPEVEVHQSFEGGVLLAKALL